MKVRHTQACFGKEIDVWRVNLATVWASIRKAQVICYDDEEVWSLLRCRFSHTDYGEEKKDVFRKHKYKALILCFFPLQHNLGHHIKLSCRYEGLLVKLWR
jgi:hypothetical protein